MLRRLRRQPRPSSTAVRRPFVSDCHKITPVNGAEGRAPRQNWGLAACLVAFVAFLPFLYGTLLGRSFFYRDLGRHYFPLRQFAAQGLRQGEFRYWNPFVHEGEPAPPPVSYPVDLLHVIVSDEAALSLILALHVPLAALALLALARGMRLSPTAAAAGALLYALGGFCLSSLNLYVHLEALAWAPFVILGLLRAAEGGRRDVAACALVAGVALSTTGVEITAQAILVGLVLGVSRSKPRRIWRMAAALAIAVGLSAPTLLYLRGGLAAGARASGFSTGMVMAFGVHPLTFLQTVVAAFHGDPADMVNRFWGSNFVAGHPYFLSFYLGGAALCLAAVGVFCGAGLRPVAWFAALAAVVCLGPWARLDLLVEALPFLRAARFPSKAFFVIHLAVALFAAVGADRLACGAERRAWKPFAAAALGLGGTLMLAPALPYLFPAWTRWFLGGFLPPEYSWQRRYETGRFILEDAARGGVAPLVCGIVALAVLGGRLPAARATQVAAALVAADLLRAGSGLNPMVGREFFRLDPETEQLLPALREGGRVFSCDPELGRAYTEARASRLGRLEAWSVATYMETLVPGFNVPHELRSALSRDLTGLTPERYVLSPLEAGCAYFGQIADRLRRAGVANVISTGPISDPSLALRTVQRPERMAPLFLFVYAVPGNLPLRRVASRVLPAADAETAEAAARQPGFLATGGAAVEGATAAVGGARGRVLSAQERPDELKLLVEADSATVVVVRDSWADGWRARVNGKPAPVLRCDGRHRAVEIGAGRSEVVLSYQPPALRTGLVLLAASLAIVVALLSRTSTSWLSTRATRG